MPRHVKNALAEPFRSDIDIMMKKSGPGLIRARKCASATAINSVMCILLISEDAGTVLKNIVYY
jgi:hypothetical protein